MASFSNFFPLFIFLIGTLISESQSLTCSSQSFKNRSFAHCDDLPHLNAFLHWTHNPKNSSLSVAFLAAPPRTGGWVAWAVNPTATGMAGAQAFIAFLSGTAPAVRTFNITSYSSVDPSPLAFPVWNLAAESSAGRFAIFASFKVPANAKSLNQVWQVGPAADPESGEPSVHEFKPANLNAKSVLVFDKKSSSGVSGVGSGPASAPRAHGGESASTAPVAVGGNETATAAAAPDKGGAAGIRNGRLGLVVGLLGLFWGLFVFNLI